MVNMLMPRKAPWRNVQHLYQTQRRPNHLQGVNHHRFIKDGFLTPSIKIQLLRYLARIIGNSVQTTQMVFVQVAYLCCAVAAVQPDGARQVTAIGDDIAVRFTHHFYITGVISGGSHPIFHIDSLVATTPCPVSKITAAVSTIDACGFVKGVINNGAGSAFCHIAVVVIFIVIDRPTTGTGAYAANRVRAGVVITVVTHIAVIGIKLPVYIAVGLIGHLLLTINTRQSVLAVISKSLTLSIVQVAVDRFLGVDLQGMALTR